MAKTKKPRNPESFLVAGPGGATHQAAGAAGVSLTTNQGVTVADNQNTLKSGERGPSLLEDFQFREKITHFDHERIPERIVHARGSGAHGYFEVTNPIPKRTRASFLSEKGNKTEVFARFSTVAGGAGAGDLPRDVRGFAVKFYTDEGNFDLVGNNIPVFFTNDPLLQGRLFSYTDTQLSRLGGANFHELPINRPRCPMRNLQRDGMRRMDAVPGRVAYEPNSLDPSGPRENPALGFRSFALQAEEGETGEKLRIRPESFADHYSQARQFYRSMTAPEQRHIQSAFAFELSKVETPAIRRRMLGHLAIVDEGLAGVVESETGMEREEIAPYRAPIDLDPSPALSIVGKATPTLKGRKIGALVTDGIALGAVEALRKALEEEGAELAVVAPKIGGIQPKSGSPAPADMALSGAPSVFFDAVAVFASEEGGRSLAKLPAAVDWLRDAFAHLKVIGRTAAAAPLFEKAGLADEVDEGLIEVGERSGVERFIEASKRQRVWDREERILGGAA
jgi:Catalase/Catalase-related immune-responsive/C-terminal domain found in long catalases